MTDAMHTLADGFALIARGQRLTAGGLLAASISTGAGILFVFSQWGNPDQTGAHTVGVSALVVASVSIQVAAAGVVIAFIGRCKLLTCPPELPRTRASAKFAVVFEGCGWLHLLSAIAVIVGVNLKWFALETWVCGAGLGLALLLLLVGQIFYLVFCRDLCRLMGEPDVAVGVAVRSAALLLGAMLCGIGGPFTVSFAGGFVAAIWQVNATAARRLADACRRHAFTVDES